MKKYKVYIGIDCGVNTGYASWSKEKGLWLHTMPIHKAFDNVRMVKSLFDGDVFVRVEDARKANFGRQKDYFKAQGAGSVKRDAKIWEDFLTDLGVDFEMVRPNKKATKMNAATFKKITGYQGQTNSHSRDAAMLVFGL